MLPVFLISVPSDKRKSKINKRPLKVGCLRSGKLSCKVRVVIASFYLFRRDPSAQQVVLYSESEKRLQVRNEDNMQVAVSTPKLASQYCRECGQRLPAKGSPPIHKPSSPEASFIDRNYFRLLDISSKSKELHAVDETDSDDYIPPKNLSESAFNQGYYRRFFREDAKLGRGSGGSVFKW